MATTITKLFPTGVLQSRVELNEVTYNSIKVGPNGVYAAFFDEVSMKPPPPLDLTSNVAGVFVGTNGNGGTGVPGVPVELGYSIGGTAFPTAIAGGLVPVGSRVYVRWTWLAYLGSSYNALVDMGVVSAVFANGDNSYVMVSNPNGVSRPFYAPDPVSGYINSNIVAYDASEVYVEYPPPAERKTSTGTYLVSGYFDEHTLAPPPPVTYNITNSTQVFVSPIYDFPVTRLGGNYTDDNTFNNAIWDNLITVGSTVIVKWLNQTSEINMGIVTQVQKGAFQFSSANYVYVTNPSNFVMPNIGGTPLGDDKASYFRIEYP